MIHWIKYSILLNKLWYEEETFIVDLPGCMRDTEMQERIRGNYRTISNLPVDEVKLGAVRSYQVQ